MPAKKAKKRPIEKVPTKHLVKEAHSPRGLVPSTSYGRLDIPYNTYLAELDPKGESERSEAVRFALAASNDVRFRAFLTNLSDPLYKTYSLATIAKLSDISLPQFAEFWQKAQHSRALAIAQTALPALTVDLVEDARSVQASCDRCDGFGWVYCEDLVPANTPGLIQISDSEETRQIRSCPLCKGTGTTRTPGDVDSRKMLLDMTGVSKKGPSMQITQNFGGMAIESAVEKMSRVSFDLTEPETIEISPQT